MKRFRKPLCILCFIACALYVLVLVAVCVIFGRFAQGMQGLARRLVSFAGMGIGAYELSCALMHGLLGALGWRGENDRRMRRDARWLAVLMLLLGVFRIVSAALSSTLSVFSFAPMLLPALMLACLGIAPKQAQSEAAALAPAEGRDGV